MTDTLVNLSHSQLTSWAKCSEQYRLERVVKVPQRPAWYSIGGSAVHETTEARDLERHRVTSASDPSTSFEDNFARLTADAEDESGLDRAEFRAGGRRSKEWPDKENEAWWLAHGPVMVARWDSFITAAPFDLWIDPNTGKPGVEVGFQIALDGGRVNLRGYIDRVLVNRQTGEVSLWDIKSGASKQPTAQQLGTYRVGFRRTHGVDALTGYFWDARSGTAEPWPLNEFDDRRLDWQFRQLRLAREMGLYIANPSPMCSSCSVRDYCYAVTPDATASVEPPWGWAAEDVAPNVR